MPQDGREGNVVDVTEYGNGWIGYTPLGPPVPRELRPKPVATYRATVPASVAGSSIAFAPDIDRDELIVALNERPEGMPFVWPDRELRTDNDLRTLALLEVLAIVSFGTRWPSLDPADILAQARADDPDLAAPTEPWLRVTGEALPNGDAGFGVETIASDEAASPDILGTDNDRFIKAVVGADLIRLIREQGALWDPFAMA